jgi:hypothetical protein
VRSPRDVIADLRLPLGSVREKIAVVRWVTEIGFGPVRRVLRDPDPSLAEALRRRGIDGPLADGILRPFLAGVLAEDDFATSRRFAELLVRSFVRGTPGVPERGMRAIPEQLAAHLPPGAIRLNTPVRSVHDGATPTVLVDGGEFAARAVVVAADPVGAARLAGTEAPRMRALTTFYHLAPRTPATRTMLHLDAERRGPLVNTAVMTDAAPSYAPGRVLVASTTLGTASGGDAERRAREHAGVIYGVDTGSWEHVATYPIAAALPATPPGTPVRRPVRVGERVVVVGDHRDTASIQGALVSGRRGAAAVRRMLRGGA